MKRVDERFDFGTFATDLIRSQGAAVQSGLDAGRSESEPLRRQLASIISVYDAVRDDPQARIPQRLALLIEHARRHL